MRVIKPKTVRDFAQVHPDAKAPLLAWLKVARLADWNDIHDVRVDYPHADAAEVKSGHTATVFNIRGNRYRLITAIKYVWVVVYVLRFLTHSEYDKEKWKGEV